MTPWIKKTAYASFFTLVACSGGGGGCGGCAGTAPLPDGFAQEARVENAATARITDSGFAFIGDNLGTLAGKLLSGSGGQTANGVLQFPIANDPAGMKIIDETYLGFIKVKGVACQGGSDPNAKPEKCVIDIDLQNSKLKLSSAAPHNLVISGTIPIKAEYIPVKLSGTLSMDIWAGLGEGSCSGGITYADIPIDGDISIETDTVPDHMSRYGMSKIKITKLDPKLDKNQVKLCGDCSGVLCQVWNSILGGIKDMLFSTLVDQIKKPLTSQLDEALCIKGATKDPATACPEGSTPEDTKDPTQGKCLFKDKSCVGQALGTEGQIDLGSMLASISPATKGTLDYQFALGGPSPNPQAPSGNKNGDLNPAAKGATLSLMGGALPHNDNLKLLKKPLVDPGLLCMTPVPLDKPAGIPQPTELLGNTVDGWPAGLAGPHFGLGLSERFLNYFMGGVYNSGALCIQITSETVSALTASKIGLLAKSINTLLLNKKDQQLGMLMRPSKPPVVTVGKGTDKTKDPTLSIVIPALSLDFYTWTSDRFIRAFTVTTDISVPVVLDMVPEGLQPTIGDLKLANTKVSNAEFLVKSEADALGPAFAQLVGGLVGQALGGGIKPIDVSGLLKSTGLTLTIPPSEPGKGSPGIRKLTKDTDNFLGLFGTLGIAPSQTSMPLGAIPKTQVDIVSTHIVTEGVHLATYTDDNATVVTLRAQSSLDDGQHVIEYQYKVDNGFWRPWQRDAVLVVTDPYLRTQGKHEIVVRSRAVGYPDSITESKVPVRVDTDAPAVGIRRSGEKVILLAGDAVTEEEKLVVRYALDDGPWTEWTAFPDVHDVDVTGHWKLAVEARDEEGHVGSTSQELRGRPDKTGTSSSGGCGCEVPGGGHGRSVGWLSAFALGSVLAFLRARRTRAARLASAAAVVGVVASFPGCNCGSSDQGDDPEGAAGAGGGGAGGSGGSAPSTCTPGADCVTLKKGLIGSYTSVAVTSDGKTAWVAGYNEADYSEDYEYGDLVVGKVNGTKVDWTTVDGTDPKEEPDPKSYDTNGWRGGKSEPGPNVGIWTSIAIGDGNNPVVAYYDMTNSALKFASFDGTKWTAHSVDQKAGASYGRYAKMAIVDGKPVIAYLAIEGQTNGDTTSNVKIARATKAVPSATGDWTFESVLAKPAQIPCRPQYCGSGTKCNADSNKCEKTGTCTPKCSGDTCFVDAKGTPACHAERTSATPDAYPEATGLYIALATKPDKKSLGLIFYDRLRGDLWKAEKASAGWEAKLVDGQDGSGKDTGDAGIGASLFIDAKGDWHITYVEGQKEALKYARLQGGAVPPAETSLIDQGDDPAKAGSTFADGVHIVGDDSNVFVDGSGAVRVVYQDATAMTIRTATKSGATWTRKIIKVDQQMAGFFPQWSTIDGKLVIAAFQRNNGAAPVGDVALATP